MSCIVPDIELADKNLIKELGFFLTTKFRDTHFLFQKSTNPQNQQFVAQNMHGIVISHVLPRAEKGEYFATLQKEHKMQYFWQFIG